MTQWEFEHWNEGKVYLHNMRWDEFRKNIAKYGYKDEKHDWQHNRIFCRIHTPRDNLTDIPCTGTNSLKHKIETVEKWTMIYESFPAFERTVLDPEGWLPSWNLYAENRLNGEPINILTTGPIEESDLFTIYLGRSSKKNTFAYFRDKYWIVSQYQDLGIGNAPPQNKKPKKKENRSIFDPFEESW